MAKDVRQKNSLVDFEAVFVALKQARLGCDLLVRGRETGKGIGRRKDQRLEADKTGAVSCEVRINRFDVLA